MTDLLSNVAAHSPSTAALKVLVDRLGSHADVNRKDQVAAPEFAGLLDALTTTPTRHGENPEVTAPPATSAGLAPSSGHPASAAARAAAQKYKTSAAEAR